MALKWLHSWRQIDAFLDPFTEALLQKADMRGGESGIDIGCGPGTTTLRLAKNAAPGGRVIGVDISRVLIDIAKTRVADRPVDTVRFERADASVYPFEEERADLAISRFGVMFFDDPVGAFLNIRRGLKRDGRLVFVCWQGVDQNPWMHSGIQLALQYVPPPEPTQPGTPGAFAFADPDRVRAILVDAGFRNVEIEAVTPQVVVAPTAKDATAFFVELGPGSNLFKDLEPPRLEQVTAKLIEHYAEHTTEDGVQMGAAAWLVAAVH